MSKRDISYLYAIKGPVDPASIGHYSFSRFRQERDINSFQFILFLLQQLEMSIFSNINVFDDHLMYHKTTRSYLERSGNPEKFPKKEKASKKSENMS